MTGREEMLEPEPISIVETLRRDFESASAGEAFLELIEKVPDVWHRSETRRLDNPGSPC